MLPSAIWDKVPEGRPLNGNNNFSHKAMSQESFGCLLSDKSLTTLTSGAFFTWGSSYPFFRWVRAPRTCAGTWVLAQQGSRGSACFPGTWTGSVVRQMKRATIMNSCTRLRFLRLCSVRFLSVCKALLENQQCKTCTHLFTHWWIVASLNFKLGQV